MYENFEDSIENMMNIMCPIDIHARVRLTALGPDDRVDDAISVIDKWEEIGSRCRDALFEGIGSGKTLSLNILDPAQFIRELKPVAPDVLMLISWGFPLTKSEYGLFSKSGLPTGSMSQGWRGRGVVFRWDSLLSAPEECNLSASIDEADVGQLMSRIHLWRMEHYRTHHQWKQGFTDAAHVQMV